MAAWRYGFNLLVLKTSLMILSTLENKIRFSVSPHSHVISSINLSRPELRSCQHKKQGSSQHLKKRGIWLCFQFSKILSYLSGAYFMVFSEVFLSRLLIIIIIIIIIIIFIIIIIIITIIMHVVLKLQNYTFYWSVVIKIYIENKIEDIREINASEK